MSATSKEAPRCLEVQQAILLGSDTDSDLAHRDTCAACQAHSAELVRVRAAFDAASQVGLDDMQRARIQAGLMEQIERPAHRAVGGASRPGRNRFLKVAAWAAAAVVLLALGVMLQRLLRPEPKSTRGAVVARANDPRLVPYLISGPSLVGYSTELGMGQALKAVDIPRGGHLRAALVAGTAGPWSRRMVGRVTLIGPARVSVKARGAGAMELHLQGGLLLARVIPGRGRIVRVKTGAVTTEVLGTVFAVEARRGSPVQVAVARGLVAVDVDGGAATRVAAGQRWSKDASSVRAMGPRMKRLLADHQRGLEPSPPAESGTLLLSGMPMSATARLGREVIGRSPLAALLPTGQATVSLSAPDHHPSTITAQILRGRVARLGYSLEAVSPEPTGAGELSPIQGAPVDGSTPPAPRQVRRTRPGRAITTTGAVPSTAPDSGPAARAPAPSPDAGVTKIPVKPESAETLYQRAEQALRSGSSSRARGMLTQLLRRHATDPLASTALLDLARLDFNQGNGVSCRKYIRRLLARKTTRVHHDPAHFLLCRLAIKERKNQQAKRCLEKFRGRFPASPHDQRALYTLGRLALTARDCAAAKKLFRHYLGKYPRGEFVNQVTKLYATCTRR